MAITNFKCKKCKGDIGISIIKTYAELDLECAYIQGRENDLDGFFLEPKTKALLRCSNCNNVTLDTLALAQITKVLRKIDPDIILKIYRG